MKKSLILLILIGVFSSACSLYKKAAHEDQKVTRITYRFIDSSVPPQYHRSYSIEVYPTSIKLIVDSYGDVLLEKIYSSNPEIFNSAMAAFDSAKIRKGEEKDSPGCTGGKSEKVILHNESETSFSAYVYHCMGDWGDLRGNIEKFSKEIKVLIPDLVSIIAAL